MPNPTQYTVLKDFLGDNGIYFETVIEYAGLDLGTKVSYLQRAINEDCQTFLQSLDRLYQPELIGDAKIANLELIRALKVINDFCFNNEVRYSVYGDRPALMHYFGALGPIVPADFQAAVQEIIGACLRTLHQDHEGEVEAQKAARERAEAGIVRQTDWRRELDLPLAQLPPAPVAAGGLFYRPLPPESPPEFSWQFSHALTALTTNIHRRLTAADAMATIRGLTREQLLAISDIAIKIGALDGLTDPLRVWAGPPEFSLMHGLALTALTTNTHRRLAAAAAIAEIQGVTRDERLFAIRDISQQVGALDGLGDALRTWVSPTGFSFDHKYALIALTTHEDPGHRLTAAAAIAEIRELTGEPLLTMRDISEKIGALDGLGDALRAWVSPPEFSMQHKQALTALTTHEAPERRLTAENAMAEIQGMSAEQALRVVRGESREQIFGPPAGLSL